jgi:hypothetical protein
VGGAGPQPAAPPAATGKVKVVDRVDLLLGLLAELDDVSLLEQDVLNGHLLLLDTVSLPLSLLPAPLARLDARRGALEWLVFNRRGPIQARRSRRLRGRGRDEDPPRRAGRRRGRLLGAPAGHPRPFLRDPGPSC